MPGSSSSSTYNAGILWFYRQSREDNIAITRYNLLNNIHISTAYKLVLLDIVIETKA